MPMTKKCNSLGCNDLAQKKETYKVLDDKFQMYSFKVELCGKCYERMYEIKERIIGDFSVFFDVPLSKKYN